MRNEASRNAKMFLDECLNITKRIYEAGYRKKEKPTKKPKFIKTY